MDANEWLEHVEGHRRSGLSAQAYARANGLVYHQLLYRINQAKRRAEESCASALVPVTISTQGSDARCVGVVELAGGTRIAVYDAPTLVSLAQCLSGRM